MKIINDYNILIITDRVNPEGFSKYKTIDALEEESDVKSSV